MLPHSLLNDVSNVLQTLSIVLLLIETESNVVRYVTLIPCLVNGLLKLGSSLHILFLLIEHAPSGDNCLRLILCDLLNQRLRMRNFLQFVLDGDLKLQDHIGVVLVLDLLGDLLSLGIKTSFVKSLGVVKLVRHYIRVELGELVVLVRGIGVVLDVEVTVAQEGESCSTSGRKV
jgi:hypothetical protein